MFQFALNVYRKVIFSKPSNNIHHMSLFVQFYYWQIDNVFFSNWRYMPIVRRCWTASVSWYHNDFVNYMLAVIKRHTTFTAIYRRLYCLFKNSNAYWYKHDAFYDVIIFHIELKYSSIAFGV